MYPPATERYQKEVLKFQQTKEYEAFRAPFDDLMLYVSQHIEEPVDFLRMSYIALGLELLVMICTIFIHSNMFREFTFKSDIYQVQFKKNSHIIRSK